MSAGLLTLKGWLALLSAAATLASVLAILHLLRQRKQPVTMLAWILAFLLLPGIGPLFYWLLGDPQLYRRVRRIRGRQQPIVEAIEQRNVGEPRPEAAVQPESDALLALDRSARELARLSLRLVDFPLTGGNDVTVYHDAEAVHAALLEAIDGAAHHVHLQYYIFRPDQTGELVRDRLVARARAGVEVRLLLDGLGAIGTPWRFLRPLTDAGARVETFLPPLPWQRGRRWGINCRNHRKIVVADGETAFTGSQNIGDEYRGRLRKLAPWKDCHLRIAGPAAGEIQEVFVEDWFFAAGEDLATPQYLRQPAPRGDSLVQVVPSGPDQADRVLGHLFFGALTRAERRIRIVTPYLVPDPALILALEHAAYRGLEVQILVSARTDSRLALWAGRSFYPALVSRGVQIHEYDEGMLHAKVVTIDERWALVGSANMDARSFRLNFELTTLLYDQAVAAELDREFVALCARSRRIGPEYRPSTPRALLEGAARLLSPLL